MSVVGSEVAPIWHAIFSIEFVLECIKHGSVEQKTIPISVQWVEQNHFTTGGLNTGRVQGLPTVIQTIVVRVGPLWIGSQFLLRLIGESISVWVAIRTLIGVRPRFGFIFHLCFAFVIVLSRIDFEVF